MQKKKFRLGELFCGAGGIACGARMAQNEKYEIEHAWASDINPDACATYKKNIGDNVICADVKDLDISSCSPIDAFAYGFPCNSFSSVGEHDGLGNERFGMLYWYGIEVLRKFHPKWFLAENVSGIASAGNALPIILKDMEESGYKLVTHLYKFEEYGVPQTRHRIIIVGIRNDINATFEIPRTDTTEDVSASTALSNIPKDAPNNEIKKLRPKTVERLSYIKPGENAFTANMPERLKIKTKTTISQIYRKLEPNKPSYTVTSNGGGGTHMYHWLENRELTNRERARLQTFPDDYEFVGGYASVRKQIGMAVPPKGAKVIFEAIMKASC